MSMARHHLEWLGLADTSGPFLSLRAVLSALPHGLEPRDTSTASALFALYDDSALDSDAVAQQGFVRHVLTDLLHWPEARIASGQSLPPSLIVEVPEHGETLRAASALLDGQGQPVFAVMVVAPGTPLERPLSNTRWTASPASRLAHLLRASRVPLGLVTNGEHWLFAHTHAPAVGYASWYAELWREEPITLRSFVSLFGARRLFGVAEPERLGALLIDSATDQAEITDQLGRQVLAAVQVLVQAVDQIDRQADRQVLLGTREDTLYEAAITVMMRLVFLLSAEERGLLLLGTPIYDAHYAVQPLRETLQRAADQHGEDVLERRFDAWARLLALFRALHGGIAHEDLRLPAYGGTLFDPDRYPFLEGRAAGTSWRDTPANPLPISNRVVLHLLRALQLLQDKVPGGGSEPRRLSFRGLDVEQIGHVYEGLLDHTARRASGPVLGLRGDVELPLADLEACTDDDKRVALLKERTGRQVPALKRALTAPPLIDERALALACGHDAALIARVKPYAALLRDDSFALPVVVTVGSLYVTAGTERRKTGTHYTPRSLTEPMVAHTLEPQVYRGPSDGLPRAEWRLKSPAELLALKICDPAMGSGAFLVQSCRWLAERLVEAWDAQATQPSQLRVEEAPPGGFYREAPALYIAPNGDLSRGAPSERLLPRDAEERLILARRLIADRCLYGVDVNPLAVEMAKLSLWLITLQKNRPFSFLDHALKCGDTLLGLAETRALEVFSLRGHTQMAFETANLWRHLEAAQAKRIELEALPSETPEQISIKVRLHGEAEALTQRLKSTADLLMALELQHLPERRYIEERDRVATRAQWSWTHDTPQAFTAAAREALGARRAFHWPLEYPEVFAVGGFDAFLGNPPFMGGQKITGNLGTDYRDYLVEYLAAGKRGSADFVAYFFLRAIQLLKPGGTLGLIAVNTIAEGDTRQAALEPMLALGHRIFRAAPNQPWPNAAAVVVSLVHIAKSTWRGGFQLNDQSVPQISAYLSAEDESSPMPLAANAGKGFIGSYVLGMGFTLSEEQAQAWIIEDPRNADVLFPYLNGEDLNSHPQQRASRWVINFWDWPEARAKQYAKPYQQVMERVKPERDELGGNSSAEGRKRKWWLYGRDAKALYHAIGRGQTFENHPAGWTECMRDRDGRWPTEQLRTVLATARVSKYLCISNADSAVIASEQTVLFGTEDPLVLALLQSSIHECWVRRMSSSLETRLRYTPSDCFETFPFPINFESNDDLRRFGRSYSESRGSLMSDLNLGLTPLYNRFHDSDESRSGISTLRDLHRQIDEAVMAAYGWQDIALDHGFHAVPYLPENDRIRYTVSETARLEILRRLSRLNRERYGAEQARVVVPKPKPGRKSKDVPQQGSLL